MAQNAQHREDKPYKNREYKSKDRSATWLGIKNVDKKFTKEYFLGKKKSTYILNHLFDWQS